MKTKPLLLLAALIVLFAFACDKDKICLENMPCSSNEYMPLAIGNFWIYELQNYNLSTYAISTSPRPDTIQVIGDTIIRNHYYYTLKSSYGQVFNYLDQVSYLRDSSGYLVNHYGEILFATSDFDRPLNRTQVSIGDDGEQFIEYAIKDTFFVKITPAGVFPCLDYRGQGWTGLDWDDDRIFHNCLSKNVGLIYQSAFYSPGPIAVGQPPTHELKRLLLEYYLVE